MNVFGGPTTVPNALLVIINPIIIIAKAIISVFIIFHLASVRYSKIFMSFFFK